MSTERSMAGKNMPFAGKELSGGRMKRLIGHIAFRVWCWANGSNRIKWRGIAEPEKWS